MATQKTPHEAAALIQARVRGRQHRSKQHRATTAVIKLQARQRGRYTRREYQKLLEFYNEQESFLAESKRRQLRLWHREQELYFLQHTTADDLDRIRHFQYARSARLIQREWKKRHPTILVDVDVSGLGRPFDPFGLIAEPPENQDQEHSTGSTREQSCTLRKELFGELPTGKTPAFNLDPERLARRRAEIHEKIQRLRRDQQKDKQQQQQQTSHADKPTRKELFDTLVTLRAKTAQRLQETRETYRATRKQRDLEATRLSASCRNRLAFLQDETRIQTLLSTTSSAALKSAARIDAVHRERREFDETTARWSDERKQRAWHNHTRIVQSVLSKTQWYETYIAGQKQDIRRVYADSPWDHTKQVWQWPAPPQKASRDAKSTDDGTTEKTTHKSTVVTAMDRFKFGLKATECGDESAQDNQSEELPAPMEDNLASSWWRAHATQSHFSYSRQQLKHTQQQSQRLRSLKSQTNQHTASTEQDALVTPEMLVNPQFYELYKKTIAANHKKELVSGVETRVSRLQRQIQHKVVDIETAIDENTRITVEKATAALQQQARKTKEETASIQIQRHVRGMIGRKRAQEHLAQYFVLVRGRAIRKGRCEECGEAQAVLECKQCEESLHFCPVCWVQVHATRRRKAHVAIPMAVHVATTSAPLWRAEPLQKPEISTASSGSFTALPATRMPVHETALEPAPAGPTASDS